MFLFLIELYVLGIVFVEFIAKPLPNLIKALSAILVGYLSYVVNGIIIVTVGLRLTSTTAYVITTLELVGLTIVLLLRERNSLHFKKLFRSGYICFGLIYIGAILVFFYNNFGFFTNDSLYLIVMGENIIDTGFSQWYFASPAWTGIYVPMLQTIGMIFGIDYVWFIQPVLGLVFAVFFVFFGAKSVRRYVHRKTFALLFALAALILLISTDLIFVMQTYIHTNFSSGVFLFLAIASIYFAIEEQQDAWLFLGTITLISFGLLRIENAIIALVVVLLYVTSGKLKRKQSILTFVPYLSIQAGWYIGVYFMDINTFTDNLSAVQILIIVAGLVGEVVLILLTHLDFFKTRVFPFINKALPYFFIAFLVFLAAMNLDSFIINVRSITSNMFVTGNWGSVWFVVVLISLLLSWSIQFPQKRILFNTILIFFLVVLILGLFRWPYHNHWYDSANRMLTHIAPVVLFYLITLAAAASAPSQQDALKGKKSI